MKRIVPKIWSEEQSCTYASFCSAMAFFCFALSPSVIWFYISTAVFGIYFLLTPVLNGMLVKASEGGGALDQGNLQGALGSLRTLAAAFGAAIMSALYGLTLHFDPISIVFATAGLLQLLVTLYFHCLWKSDDWKKTDGEDNDPSDNTGSDDIRERLISGEP